MTLEAPRRYLPRPFRRRRRSSAVEQGNHNPLVGGSNPPAATNRIREQAFVLFRVNLYGACLMPAPSVSRRIVLGLAVGTALVAAARGSFAQALPAPALPIKLLYDTLLVIMKEGRTTPFTQRAATLAPAVDRALDLPRILQSAVGPSWPSVPPAQQNALLAAFRSYTIATYVANFDTNSGDQMVVSPDLRSLSNGDRVVNTKIGSHEIDYVMRQGPRGWQTVDVLLDGSISRVAVLRSDFRRLLASGPSVLAEDLQHKAADLMGGMSPV